MTGLLDIAPRTETVDIRGTEVTVTGINAKGIARLLARFPDLRLVFAGRDVEFDRLCLLAGDAVGPVLAAGCGYAGQEEYENKMGELLLDEQAEVFAAIMKVTMPQGIGPFVDRLSKLGLTVNATAIPATAPATK